MPRTRRFIWYFLALALLGAIAIALPIIANLRQQITLEQVAEARERWQKYGPASYDLHYLERIDNDEIGDVYEVKVRAGEVVSLRVNSHLKPVEEMKAEARGLFTVPGLFQQIEDHLSEEKDGKRRNFATAYFDPELGFPVHYIRRVRGSRSRLEWNVRLTPIKDD